MPNSNKLQKYMELLEILQQAKPKQRKQIIEASNNDFIKLLCECCLNILYGPMQITPEQKRKLKKYAPIMRQIASKKQPNKSLAKKRELILQNGGFLPALLAPIISLAGGLIGELVGRHL